MAKGRRRTVEKAPTYEMPDVPDDLCDLSILDNNNILQCLTERYKNDQIYTYVGDILVALNPCKPLPIYDGQHQHMKYTNLLSKSDQPPHIYWTAELAYRSLTNYHVSRCIVVSGISGSGKTECTKHVLKHVLSLVDSQKCIQDLITKLEQIDPLLELFGNARTSLNCNSSRFGKLTLLQYDNDNNLIGAKIQPFMLEKSRIIRQQEHEKNFHIFYALLAGLSQNKLQQYGLTGHKGLFRILTNASHEDSIHTCKENPAYQEMFKQAMKNLKSLDFNNEAVDGIFKILAAILLLTNIEFTEDEHGQPVIEEDIEEEFLRPVCDLLRIDDTERFILALIADKKQGVDCPIPKTIQKAEEGRDALAKYLYCCMFEGIVRHLNASLSDRNQHGSRESVEGRIGILDISGFEDLKSSKDVIYSRGHSSCNNSYEQLFINITNEQLHQFFLKHVFVHEKEEYEREGVSFAEIDFTNNTDVLELLISASPNSRSIVSLMEDCNLHPGSTDETFVGELNKNFDQMKYYKKHVSPLKFEVIHFAGNVVYSASNFLAKNTDTLSISLRKCIRNTDNVFLNKVARIESSISRVAMHEISKRRSSENRLQGLVSRDYMKSQSILRKTLESMKPLFVRCIQPNTAMKQCQLDKDYVMHQLQSGGVLEVAEVRRLGYSVRLTRHEFVQSFAELIEHMNPVTDEEKVQCIFHQFDISKADYLLGITKVFMKEKVFGLLSRSLEENRQAKRSREQEAQRCKTVIETEFEQKMVDKEFRLTVEHNDQHISVTKGDDCSRHESVTRIYAALKSSRRNSLSSDISLESEDTCYPVKHKEDKLAYDMFRDKPKQTGSSNNCDIIETIFLRVSRFLMYVVLFGMVLGSGVLVKVWILSLVSTFGQSTAGVRGVIADKLMVCLVVPWGVTFLLALIKILFGKVKSLQMKYLVPIVLLDTSHGIGIVLMLFIVLPVVDVFLGAVIMMCVGSTPALLVLINNIRSFKFRTSRLLKNVLAFIAFGIQIVGSLALGCECYKQNTNFPIWAFVLSCILIGVGWWENFAHGQIHMFKSLLIDFTKIKSILKQSRQKSNAWGMFMKILVTLVFVQLYVKADINQSQDALNSLTKQLSISDKTPQFSNHVINSVYRFYIENDIVFHVIFFTLLCTYASTLACKLNMQRLAFSLPIVLVAPMVLVILYLTCDDSISMYGLIPSDIHCPESGISNLRYTIAIGTALWLSSISITWYIWVPRQERMAKTENMFVEPLKEAAFLDMNLLLRRMNDNIVTRENTGNNNESSFPNTKTNPAKEENNNDLNISRDNQKVFICATLWREEQHEMLQLLQSLFRLDKHCLASRCAEEKFNTRNPDKFQPEIHIMFDDAFNKHSTYNEFVEQLIELVGIAAHNVVGAVNWEGRPNKSIHPYGERLVWTLPGETKMMVHLKDRSKIRHRKRWSQIMYLYYLLGFMFTGYSKENQFLTKTKHRTNKVKHDSEGGNTEKVYQENDSKTKQDLFDRLPNNKRENITNTFILTLDGDVDFQPEAVLLLLDRMKKNEKVGAVCGRIHPIGSGPMIWYQKFEYAIGHWLQKATEHVLGCVLCCPGCFSLFRASALMSDGVMKTYTTKPENAKEYLQYEQGEDRWLSTLLLQRGYKIDYCAGADAYTYAPESLDGFFVQRRRWAQSSLFSIIDVLAGRDMIVQNNSNISQPFMFYQLAMLVTSILAPASVINWIAGSFSIVLNISFTYGYLIALAPVVFYLYICLRCSNDLQLKLGALLTAVYTTVMLLVTVGVISNIMNDDNFTPIVLFLMVLLAIFVLTGLWHPKEIDCLLPGILYYVTVPSTFVFLPIFYLCNLNNISWGTREGPKTEDVIAKTGWELFFEYMRHSFCEDVVTFIRRTLRKSDVQETAQHLNAQHDIHLVIDRQDINSKGNQDNKKKDKKYKFNMSNKYEEENAFWTWLIAKYLEPISEDVNHQKRVTAQLLELRNNAVFAFLLVNLLFSIALLQLQINRDQLSGFYINGKYEPVAVGYLGFASLLLITQFICMLFHRWGTFQHLISSTHLLTTRTCRSNKLLLSDKEVFDNALKETNDLLNPDYEIPPDYDTDAEQGNGASLFQSRRNIPELEHILERNYRRERKRYINSYVERSAQMNPAVLNKTQRIRTELYGQTISRNKGYCHFNYQYEQNSKSRQNGNQC